MLGKVLCVIYKIDWVILTFLFYLRSCVYLFMNPFFPHFSYSSTVFLTLRLFLRDKHLISERDASGLD